MLKQHKKKESSDSAWFFFMLAFLVIDYGRPQDFLPISVIRPAMLVTLLLVFFVVKNNAISKSWFKQLKVIWLFILLLAILVPFARNNFFAFQAATGMLAIMPFIISSVLLINSVQRLRVVITIYIALMIYISIYSLMHGGVGSGSYFADENDVSLYINMWIPFCFFLFLNDKGLYRRLFYFTGFAIGLAAVVISFSRGGFVGLLSVFAVIWLFSPKKMLSLFLISIAVGVLYVSTGEEYKREMATVTNTEGGTASSRMRSWATAWDMFLDNPLGVGGNNFQARFSEYQGDRFKRGMWGRVAHSLWFTLIPELGIIGIVLYFKLLSYNLKDIFRVKRIEPEGDADLDYLHAISLSFIASLAGFFASATFISVLYYPHYWYMTGIIIATASIAAAYHKQSQISGYQPE